jgi:hypothetical protein
MDFIGNRDWPGALPPRIIHASPQQFAGGQLRTPPERWNRRKAPGVETCVSADGGGVGYGTMGASLANALGNGCISALPSSRRGKEALAFEATCADRRQSLSDASRVRQRMPLILRTPD